MAFRCEMHHGARLVFGEHRFERCTVAHIDAFKCITRISGERGQCFRVCRVREHVHVDHWLVMRCQPIENEVATDEAAAASDQNHVSFLCPQIL